MPELQKYKLKIEDPNSGPKDDQFEPIENAFDRTVAARAKTIQTLKEVGYECHGIDQVKKGLEIGGGVVSVIGNLTTIAGGIATIATAGAAATPFLVGSLMWSGFGVGVLGAGLKIGGGIHGDKTKAAQKKLDDAIKEDVEAHSDLMNKIQTWQRRQPSSKDCLFIIKVLAPTLTSGFHTLAIFAGTAALTSFLETILRPLDSFVTEKTELYAILALMIGGALTHARTVLTEIPEIGASKAAQMAAEAVKTMEEGFIKKQAYQAALKSAEEILKSSSDEALGAAANQAVKKVSNEAVKAAGKVATEVAKQSSDGVAIAAVETVGKVATEVAKQSSDGVAIAAVETVGKVATEVAKQSSDGVAIAAVETVGKVATEVAKQSTDDVAIVAVEAVGKVATEVAKQSTDDIAIVAARTAAENTAKNLATVAGGITIGLGAVSVVWDLYNIAQDSQKTSIGDELIKWARELEDQLDSQNLKD